MASHALHGLSPSAELEALRGWEKLEPQEQTAVRAEYRAIADALHSEGKSRLAVGQHLVAAQEILAPKRMFDRFIRQNFHLSRSTAFNYINLYKAALQDAPKKVLDIAMSKNYRAINKPHIFKTYPPPKTNSPAKIIQYLDKLEKRRSKVVSIHKSPDNLIKQALHSVGVCWEKIPKPQRREWSRQLIGMQMSRFGVGGDINPVPVPESFNVVRGRPKTNAA